MAYLVVYSHQLKTDSFISHIEGSSQLDQNPQMLMIWVWATSQAPRKVIIFIDIVNFIKAVGLCHTQPCVRLMPIIHQLWEELT